MIITKAQQDFNAKDSNNPPKFEISPEDINCHVFLFGHIPLVFFTMCVLSMLLKMRLLTATLNLSVM
jgi:hypothetical protein